MKEITIDEAESHPSMLSTLTIGNVRIFLLYTGDPLTIVLFWNNDLIFYKNYNPGPLTDYTTLDIMADIIFWLTLSEEDGVDLEESYTSKQLQWSRSSECADLKILGNDYEDREGYALIELNAGFYHC